MNSAKRKYRIAKDTLIKLQPCERGRMMLTMFEQHTDEPIELVLPKAVYATLCDMLASDTQPREDEVKQ